MTEELQDRLGSILLAPRPLALALLWHPAHAVMPRSRGQGLQETSGYCSLQSGAGAAQGICTTRCSLSWFGHKNPRSIWEGESGCWPSSPQLCSRGRLLVAPDALAVPVPKRAL